MEHDHMVQAVPPNGTNHPLDVGPLPRRARRGQHFFYAHVSHLFSEVRAEDGVPVAQQVARQLVEAHVPNLRGIWQTHGGWGLYQHYFVSPRLEACSRRADLSEDS